jgi:exopolysaccharide biosynthesis polyprenyl glycosylphosphotransferase
MSAFAESPVLRRYRRLAELVAVSDALCLVVAMFGAYAIRYGMASMAAGYIIATVTGPVLWIVVFRSVGLYRFTSLAAWDEFRRVVLGCTFGVGVIAMASFWSKAELSRKWVGLILVFSFFLTLASRYGWRKVVTARKRHGTLAFRTAIVGVNAEARELVGMLSQSNSYRPVAFVAGDPAPREIRGLPVRVALDNLETFVQEMRVDCLYVASTALPSSQMPNITRVARQFGLEVRVTTNMLAALSPPLTIRTLGATTTLSLSPVRLSRFDAAVKRCFDCMIALGALVVLLPLTISCAVAVKLTSKGPVMFRQDRVTRGGRIFRVFKFRTMRVDAEAYLEQMGIDRSAAFFKLGEDDPRITAVGRFLRRYSLDELPQLLNVVKGDMSLVGPRPLPREQVDANRLLMEPRLEVRAGLSGWWQISGRSDADVETALRMDLFYIENWSLALDAFILAKTLSTVFFKRGAY